jgi:hypothetical protein
MTEQNLTSAGMVDSLATLEGQTQALEQRVKAMEAATRLTRKSTKVVYGMAEEIARYRTDGMDPKTILTIDR